jgi:hypothetical protein
MPDLKLTARRGMTLRVIREGGQGHHVLNGLLRKREPLRP